MSMNDENKKEQKDRLWSGLSSVVSIALIIVLLLTFGLKSQIPPPPPKKTFYVELDAEVGGGGGGGMDAPSPNKVTNTAAPNYATQNASAAPAVSHSENTSTTTTQPAQPKVDQSAMFKGGKGGSGSGGGQGSGIGTGTGSGLGPGEGGGSGGGVGYGTGNRGLVKQINTSVNEEGQVCVEVHVLADGTVSEARVINNSKHKTTIANRTIQQQCVQEAKRAKYKPGKEELRIIVFH